MLPGLPYFAALQLPCIIFNTNQRIKDEVVLGTMQGVTYRALWVGRESSRNYKAANPLRMAARRALE